MQILVMNKKSNYYHVICSKCGQRIRQGRQFVLDPELSSGKNSGKPVPLAYHKVCFDQLTRKQ